MCHVDRVVCCMWRLRRLIEEENRLLSDDGRNGTRAVENGYAKLAKYEAGIERSMHRALSELRLLQAARRGRSKAAGEVVTVDLVAGARAS